MLAAGYPKARIPFHVPNNITCCVSLPFPSTSKFFSISTWPVCTRHKQDFIPFSIDSRCLLQIGDQSPDICICSLSSPPHIYVSNCMYVYVHISLFLPQCACTTIIDISPRILILMYCCCVSIIIVICICPPGALIWLLNLFLFLFL